MNKQQHFHRFTTEQIAAETILGWNLFAGRILIRRAYLKINQYATNHEFEVNDGIQLYITSNLIKSVENYCMEVANN